MRTNNETLQEGVLRLKVEHGAPLDGFRVYTENGAVVWEVYRTHDDPAKALAEARFLVRSWCIAALHALDNATP